MDAARTVTINSSSEHQATRVRIRTKRSWKNPKQEKGEVVKATAKLQELRSTGVDAQELCMRLEAYVAKAGPQVADVKRCEIEDEWDEISDADTSSARRSVYAEDLLEKRKTFYSELGPLPLPPPNSKLNMNAKINANTGLSTNGKSNANAKLNSASKLDNDPRLDNVPRLDSIPKARPQKTKALSDLPFQLPELEIMKIDDLFHPHLPGPVQTVNDPAEMQGEKARPRHAEASQNKYPLEQVEEVDQLPDIQEEHTCTPRTESPQSQTALRRMAPLEGPRKAYQLVDQPSQTKTISGSDKLEASGREVAEKRCSTTTNLPQSAHVEHRVNNEEPSTARRMSAPSLQKSKSITKLTRFADEKQVWNGTDKLERNTYEQRRRSLPLLSAIKKNRGVGSEISVAQECNQDATAMVRRGCGSWRLLGKRDKVESTGMKKLESSPKSGKGGFGICNIFKR